MNSVFTMVAVSTLAVIGLYFLATMAAEVIFGRGKGRIIAVVPVASPEIPLEEILKTLRENVSIGKTVLVDYGGQLEDQKQQPGQFPTIIATPENLGNVLREVAARCRQ